jgi:hypothetical protein
MKRRQNGQKVKQKQMPKFVSSCVETPTEVDAVLKEAQPTQRYNDIARPHG